MGRIEDGERLSEPVKQATLCFITDGEKVLLGMKKRGFAVGKWNGFGGKREDSETVQQAAEREVWEESGVKPKSLIQSATLNCYHPTWSQQVIVYTTSEWVGIPEETDEMEPQWFPKDEIPYDQMWSDAPLWLPLILEQEKVVADLIFNEKGELLAQKIIHIETFE